MSEDQNTTIDLKFQPTDRAMFYWAAAQAVFFISFISLMAWGGTLSKFVDVKGRETISINLSLIFLMAGTWFVRESLPFCYMFFKLIYHETFIAPREYKEEMRRKEEEWHNKIFTPPPPKQRRVKKPQPIGEPINLKQWFAKGSYWRGGYIYIVKDVEISGYYKIGKTKAPYDRMKTFGVQLPFAVELIHVIHCHDADRVERQLHMRYADKRKNGEWFALDENDLTMLKLLNKVEAPEPKEASAER